MYEDAILKLIKVDELEESKKKKKKKVNALGWFQTFTPDAGNVEYNNAFFNHVMGNTDSSEFADAVVSAESGGMGESLETESFVTEKERMKPFFSAWYNSICKERLPDVAEFRALWSDAQQLGITDYFEYIEYKQLNESVVPTKLVWYTTPAGNSPVKQFYESTSEDIQGAFDKLFYNLVNNQLHTIKDCSKLLDKKERIFELRVKDGATWARITYTREDDGTVLLTGFNKKQNKTDPDEIKQAIRNKHNYRKYHCGEEVVL